MTIRGPYSCATIDGSQEKWMATLVEANYYRAEKT